MFIDDLALRDTYVKKIDVLDKVKVLSLLPDNEHMTTKMVAEYYRVDNVTIRQIIVRHNEELLTDGLRVIKGHELKTIKTTLLHDVTELKKSLR